MDKQSKKSEQITQSLSIVHDFDDKMTTREEFVSAFEEALGEVEVVKYKNTRICPIKYTHNNKDTYFLTGAITWLNKPHPLFKKRLQLKDWYRDFYEEYMQKENTDIRIVGVYRYDNMHIFVEFNIDDYIDNKLKNSSAHIYINDLYQALKNDYVTKKDKRGNTITAVSSKNFKKYIDGEIEENSDFDLFVKFNNTFPFGEWITAKSAIEKMKSKNFPNWRKTEWAGWFLEYEMDKFIENEQCQNTMKYIINKKKGDLDFDLFFKEDDFFGDLKASNINTNEAPGNDKENTLKAINEKEKLWYIIYEHETKKDTDYNSEMAIARMELIGEPYEEGSKISYKDRMKHSVKFKKMKILEINKTNKNILKQFNQGRNSNGKKRRPKCKIPKRYIDGFVIYSYEAY